MMKSSVTGLLCSVSWVVTGLAAVLGGLAALGYYDFFKTGFLVTNPSLMMVLNWVILLAGLVSLAGFAMMVAGGKCCGCGCAACSSK